ncbi:MAG: radical SAM protein, partial [Spirochaetota bacterium]|nr:radical SAM protein [Spirochaetota bacterium]
MTAVRFLEKTQKAISKNKITVLQINLGRKCNLSCSHCHVEASPKRTEEISDDVKYDIIQLIRKFSQIESVDLTGGAPEFHSGFRDIVKAAWEAGKEVIVRSNLVILLEEGYRDLPDFFVKHGVRLVASLPCYLEENVDSQRGAGTYNKSIEAIRILNQKGYGDSLT